MPDLLPIRKAVFPVAGLGTRFLPATKSIPKEMLPILDKPLIQYAVEEYGTTGAGIVGVEEIAPSMTDCYGIVSVEKSSDGRDYIHAIVEKPAPENAPSNLGVVGRYILPGKIFALLESVRAGVGGEIQLTDAISAQLATQPMMAHAFDGVRYDCGSRQGFIRATLAYALEDDELREDLLAFFNEGKGLKSR